MKKIAFLTFFGLLIVVFSSGSAFAQFQTRYDFFRNVDESIGERTIQTTPTGGTIRVGTITQPAGDTDIVVTSVDSSGLVQWSHTYGTAGVNETGNVIVRSDQIGNGGFLVVGSTDLGSGGSDLDILAISISAGGNMNWAHR